MGLGHMRRNLLLAQALRHSRLQAVVLMIAGAREASLLTSTAGVDCVALPSLWKDGGGQYHPRHLAVSLEELLALRGRTAGAALEAFAPDVLIVDTVPRGALRELDPVLESLRARGRTRLVLGLRDVLGEPATLQGISRSASAARVRSTQRQGPGYGAGIVWRPARALSGGRRTGRRGAGGGLRGNGPPAGHRRLARHRPMHAGRRAATVSSQRRERSLPARGLLRARADTTGASRGPRRCNGRVQHRLRGPVVRKARAHRAPCQAPTGAADPRRAAAGAGARRRAPSGSIERRGPEQLARSRAGPGPTGARADRFQRSQPRPAAAGGTARYPTAAAAAPPRPRRGPPCSVTRRCASGNRLVGLRSPTSSKPGPGFPRHSFSTRSSAWSAAAFPSAFFP